MLSGVVVVTVGSGDDCVFDSSTCVSACDWVTTGCCISIEYGKTYQKCIKNISE